MGTCPRLAVDVGAAVVKEGTEVIESGIVCVVVVVVLGKDGDGPCGRLLLL